MQLLKEWVRAGKDDSCDINERTDTQRKTCTFRVVKALWTLVDYSNLIACANLIIGGKARLLRCRWGRESRVKSGTEIS